MVISKKVSDKLEDLKDKVQRSYAYFRENNLRYHDFKKYVCKTSLDDAKVSKLKTMGKPPLEFNIQEAIISRLRGEFSKQEPSFSVRAADSIRVEAMDYQFIDTMDIVESHIRCMFLDSTNDDLQYNLFTDDLLGGYTVARVYTDYCDEMSFHQNIFIERAFDPTLTGFDPLARDSHKGDGDYCYEMVPWTKEEFELEFGKDALVGISFARGISGMNWSYKTQDQDIILVVDFYEKVKKKEKIAKLSNGHVIAHKHYKDLIEIWEAKGFIEQPPIVIETRMTELETIERYRFCEGRMLEHKVTDFKYLPLVFIDGNSVEIRDGNNGATYQVTRPFCYHSKGAQELKNFAGQSMAAEINQMVMHKFKVALESLPDDQTYLNAYKNVQVADTLVYNAFLDKDPDRPLPPPMEIQRTPTPPIIESTFMGADKVMQMVLGSYDAALLSNSDQLSGKAIQQGALQSNAAAIPYLSGYMKGLNRIAQIILDLIPKYYVTPRTIPIMKKDGSRSYKLINHPDSEESIYLTYNPRDLQIKVEAGVNSSIQKQVAIEQLTSLASAVPAIGDFINRDAWDIIIDNLDIRGADVLKERASKFMQAQKQAAEEAKNNPPPEIATAQLLAETEKEIELTRIESQREKAQGELATASARVAIEKQKADLEFIKLMAEIENKNSKLLIDKEKINSENARTAVEASIKMATQNSMKPSSGKLSKDLGE